MSIRFASLNSPALVAGVGAAVVLGLPALEAVAASSAASLALLKSANALSFLVNAISVSIPGRIDEAHDDPLSLPARSDAGRCPHRGDRHGLHR